MTEAQPPRGGLAVSEQASGSRLVDASQAFLSERRLRACE